MLFLEIQLWTQLLLSRSFRICLFDLWAEYFAQNFVATSVLCPPPNVILFDVSDERDPIP